MQAPPMRRPKWRRIILILGLLLLLPLGLAVYTLLHPEKPEPLVISEETTVLAEEDDLDENGRPDYWRVLDDEMREGVTPENNLMVGLLEALGNDLFRQDRFLMDEERQSAIEEVVGEKLGVEIGPSPEPRFVSAGVYCEEVQPMIAEDRAARAAAWKQIAADPQSITSVDFPTTAVEQLQDQWRALEECPWADGDFNLVCGWIEENDAVADRLAEASQCTRCYVPCDSGQPEIDHDMLESGLGSFELKVITHWGRLIHCRSLWRCRNGDFLGATEDAMTLRCIGRIFSQNGMGIRWNAGLALDAMGRGCQVHVLRDPSLPKEVLEQIQADCDLLPEMPTPTFGWDRVHRSLLLDTLSRAAGGDEQTLRSLNVFGEDDVPSDSLVIDWNMLASRINQRHDKIAEVMSIENPVAARSDWEAFAEADSSDKPDLHANALQIMHGYGSRMEYHTLAVYHFSFALAPPSHDLHKLATHHQHEQVFDIALALAEYRQEQGAYPTSLADLVPDYLSEIPADIYTAAPLHYEVIQNGADYRLFSLGPDSSDYREGDGIGINADARYATPGTFVMPDPAMTLENTVQ